MPKRLILKNSFTLALAIIVGFTFMAPTGVEGKVGEPNDPKINFEVQANNWDQQSEPQISDKVFFPIVTNSMDSVVSGNDWPMAAANPQRTSWTPEEVRGDLALDWYRPIEPYIPNKIQPIAANGKIYVSTANGLYTFRASDGALLWVYPTELPLGNSPTIATINGRSIAFEKYTQSMQFPVRRYLDIHLTWQQQALRPTP